MKEITLDGLNMTSREIAHKYIKEIMHFPEFYGFNLDALYDMLTEISEPLSIIIINCNHIIDMLGEYGELLLETFNDSAADNDNLKLELYQ